MTTVSQPVWNLRSTTLAILQTSENQFRFIPEEYLANDVRLYKEKSGWYTVRFTPYSILSKKLGLDGQYIELGLDATPEKGEVLRICHFLPELIVV